MSQGAASLGCYETEVISSNGFSGRQTPQLVQLIPVLQRRFRLQSTPEKNDDYPPVLADLVFEIPEFVSPKFCKDRIATTDGNSLEAATIQSDHGGMTRPDIRNNDRMIFDDADLAAQLWSRLAPYFPIPFKGERVDGLNPRFRLYRYSPGQFFDWHQDGCFEQDIGLVSQFTLMIYLNDTFEGGGTSFADVFSPHVFADFRITPEMGKALVFHHPISHRGDAVISGQKYVLRTDVMFRKL